MPSDPRLNSLARRDSRQLTGTDQGLGRRGSKQLPPMTGEVALSRRGSKQLPPMAGEVTLGRRGSRQLPPPMASQRARRATLAAVSTDLMGKTFLPDIAARTAQTDNAKLGQLQTSQQSNEQEKPFRPQEQEETQLEDEFTNDQLRKLQQIFQEADEDGGGGLDMEEFRVAMRSTLGNTSLTDSELDMIFMKVDTNCDGTVDLDEYLTYMLLECREKDIMSVEARQPFPRDASSHAADHRDSIRRLQFLPKVTSAGVVLETRGKYLAMSQEGVISFWSPDWKYLYSRRVEPTSPKGQTVWVTDLVCMPQTHAIAVSTTNRDIVFYDLGGKRFDRISRMTSLPACCMCLKFYMSVIRGTDSFLVWGDDAGGISALKLKVPLTMTQFNPKRFKSGRERFPYEEIKEGLMDKVTLLHLPNIHGEPVREIAYSHHLSCFISCSKDTDSAMVVGDLEQKTKSYYFRVTRGINDFEYSKKLNVIATGGFDGVVRVWNPYVPAKPIILLSDHKSPILCVHINEAREHIISIGENKELRIHDLNTQTCIQTYYRKMLPDLGPRRVSASCFHPTRQALSLATTTIAVLEHRAEDLKQQRLWSHATKIVAVRYNPLFKQVVSASQDSLIRVWNVYTGEKAMQFVAHTVTRNGIVTNVEITAITFDPTFRRLITAMRDGTVKMWNFNNGACLRELPVYDKGKEITSIVCPESKIITAGWNRRVTIYVDDLEDDTTRWLKRLHDDDILSLAKCPPHMIASSSYDGKVIIWSLDTYRLVMCTTLPFAGDLVSADDPCWAQHTTSRDESNGLKEADDDKHTYKIRSRAVEKLVFIMGREIDPRTANLLGACADGYIRAWSVHHKGCLRGQFLAACDPGTPLSSLAISKDNNFLVTADSMGYIRTWDIHVYCMASDPEPDPAREEIYNTFPVFSVLQKEEIETSKGTFTLQNCAKPPILVNSFRGHLEPISSIDLADIEGDIFIVSASGDCSVRLWNFHGESVGVFGPQSMWTGRKMPGGEKLEIGHPKSDVDPHDLTVHGCLIPPDVRRVSSATTLRTFKAGRHLNWSLAKNILLWFTRFQIFHTKPDVPTLADSPLGQTLPPMLPPIVTSAPRAGSNAGDCGKGSTAAMDIEKTNVLGNSYKRSTKHRPCPTLQPPQATLGTQCAAYHYLPPPNDTEEAVGFDTGIISEIQQRYQLPNTSDPSPRHTFKKIGKFTANLMSLTKKDSKYGKRKGDGKGGSFRKLKPKARRGSIFLIEDQEEERKGSKGSMEQNSLLGTIKEA